MIWVRLRDHPTKQVLIKESDYDEKKHIKPTKEEQEEEKKIKELNIKDMLESRKAPGSHFKIDNSHGSVLHHGKLDEGATDDLLARGIEGAKKRAKDREKKTGSGFRKMKSGNLVPKSKGKKRRK